MDTQPELYTVKWETTETVTHHATVPIEDLASMMGVPVESVRACEGDYDCLTELDSSSPRGLVNGLADIEDSDTEFHWQGPEREIAVLRRARAREVESWVTAQGTPTVEPVPADHPVKVLGPDDPAADRVTCGTCGRSWDDAIATEWTPTPAGRCPFEAWH